MGPRSEAFAPLHELARTDAVAPLLEMHGTVVEVTPDAARAVTLAAAGAVSGHRTIALVPNDQLDHAMPALGRAARASVGARGAMCVIIEDDPQGSPSTCPRQAARRLGLTCLEPGTVGQLRDAMEPAVRLSRAARAPVVVIAHSLILRSAETLEARPNRVMDPITALATRPKRRQRVAEMGGILRMARRLELNRTISVPSPGERLPVGFIVVGPAAAAIDHLIHELRLHGRVPVLHLGLLNPTDESVVERILGRCEQVVVLEPRPGSIEADILGVAETLRRRGKRPAVVCSEPLTRQGAQTPGLQPDEALHPSILARKIIHLLHLVRPGLELPFVPDPPELASPPPPRGHQLGSTGALALVRGVLVGVDQWLHDRSLGERPGAGPTALAIDGVEPEGSAQRIVSVETWSSQRFLQEGIAALRQAAWEDRPWLMVICAVGARRTWRVGEAEEARDLERLVRGAVPGLRTEGVRVETADLNDRHGLRTLLRDLATTCRLGVVIARDGPPPRFDTSALQGSRDEIDRLGYEPRQRLLRYADEACTIGRPVPVARQRAAADAGPLRTQLSVGRLSGRLTGLVRLRVRPMFEQVEVVRARPLAFGWQNAMADRLPIPRPIHGSAPQWRAHLAGFRGQAPGVAAWTLGQAGRAMGYHVRCVGEAISIGPGRWAWSQVLFTQPGRDQQALPVTATIPYGEADLLLGLDYAETLRAIDREGGLRVANLDRTCAVVNLGPFVDDPDLELSEDASARPGAPLQAVTRDEPRLLEDFSAACRTAFHTDRVTDLALLGAAFQCGLIPVTLEAIEEAARRVEARGFGRATEALRFGCHLASDRRLFARPAPSGGEDVDRLVRRMLLSLRFTRWGGRVDNEHFAGLLTRTLAAMPGLAETDPGRIARRDFALAMERCLAWGGIDYARRYAQLVTNLYRADRGDKGRAITRYAILPLAEAMLIRDPIYVATMATSPQQRRRARVRLNARPARGDRLERRYLTRVELIAFRRRVRLDLRTSDWPAWPVVSLRKRIPRRWRGTSLQRQIRDLVIDVARRAEHGAGGNYDQWAETLQRLHDQAQEGRLRGMALSELRMLVEESHQPSAISHQQEKR